MAGKKHKSQQFIDSDGSDSDDDLERELLSLAKKKKPSEPSPPAEKKSESKPAARERKPSVSDASSSSDDDTSTDENDDEYVPNGQPKKKVAKKKKSSAKPPPPKPATPQPPAMKREEEEPSDGDLSSEEERPEEGEQSEESSEEDGELPSSSSSAGESGDSDASDEELPAFNDGLDENFIGDEDDRKLLEGMSEKDREQELFNRMERREAMKTRMEIERKLHAERKREKKQQKRDSSDPSASRKKHKHRTSKGVKSEGFVGSIAARKGERAKKVEDKKTKALQALQEMKQKRSEKKEKEEKKMLAKENTKLTTKDVFSSDDDDEEAAKDLKKDLGSDSDSDSDSDGRSSKSEDEAEDEEEEEVPISTKEEMEPIRLSRHKLERWVHLPFFGELIAGCFLRMGIGNCEDKPIYRVVEIVDTSVTSKVYTLGGQRTNKALKVRHGLQERTFRMEYVSNQGFTESEFSKWKEEMNLVELPLPTLQFIKKKTEAITNAKTYEYKDDDVERMVKEKNRFRSAPLNYAVHKNNLIHSKDVAEQAGDFVEAQNIRDKLDELEEKAESLDKIRSGALSNVSFINERNRKKNVYDAEKAAIDEGKEMGRSTFGGDNPFIRRRCISLLGNDVRKMPKGGEFAKPEDKKENTTPKKPDQLTIATPPETKDANEPDSPVTKEKVINSLLAIPLAAATTATPPQPAPPASENENGDADLHLLHDFDVQITVPIPESRSISLATKPSAFHKDEGPPRRSLNLDEYKKRKGLI